ncbi:hypothetical protein BOVA604_2289 [Bacteroides ovatus]|nr:hypothetical protein BOVA604_2289 [Bacteroides ovatus]
MILCQKLTDKMTDNLHCMAKKYICLPLFKQNKRIIPYNDVYS